MALRFSSSAANTTVYHGAYLTVAGGTMGPPVTTIGWASLSLDRNNYQDAWGLYKSTGSSPFFTACVGTKSDGTTMSAPAGDGAGTSDLTGQAMTVGTWYRFAVVATATNSATFYKGTTTLTSAMTTESIPLSSSWVYNSSPDVFGVGGIIGPERSPNGRYAAVKVYNVALTAAEVEAETKRYRPVRVVNLRHWMPCHDTSTGRYPADNGTVYAADHAGGAASGGLGLGDGSSTTGPTYEDGPPIPW